MPKSQPAGYVAAEITIKVAGAEPMPLTRMNLPLKANLDSGDCVYELDVDLQEIRRTIRAIFTDAKGAEHA